LQLDYIKFIKEKSNKNFITEKEKKIIEKWINMIEVMINGLKIETDERNYAYLLRLMMQLEN
jgi:glutaredoxin 2